MRQVVGFLGNINRARVLEFYERTVSYASVHGAKMPSFDEFLGLSLGEETAPAFDAQTDSFLERQAKKKLEEAQAKHGKRK